MGSIERSPDLEDIERAYFLINDSTQEYPLTEKKGSYCQFVEGLSVDVEAYKVTFRIDWKDKCLNEHPTLDADFTRKIDNKKNAYKGQEHHTTTNSAKRRTYNWQFSEESVIITVVVIWSKLIEDCVDVTDSIDINIERDINIT